MTYNDQALTKDYLLWSKGLNLLYQEFISGKWQFVILPALLPICSPSLHLMSNEWINKPMIFFGKRINFLFAAITSTPVWLATNNYVDGLAVSDDEVVSTGITMCFFAGIFAGRYLADAWKIHKLAKPQTLITNLAIFVVACIFWLFIHADNPLDGEGLNLFLYLFPFSLMSLATGILIKIIRTITDKELTEARSSAAHSESELKLLQSQLSPHFLFNTLNNMYGLSLTQHEKIPPLLLKLSDLLRYSVYGANEIFVPLKDEVDYINNYIEFEKIRLGERLTLETDIAIQPGTDASIAPMLLIIFIENAFKHSKNSPDEKIHIDINLKTWNNLVLFSVKNSYSKTEKRFDKNSGFGLDNVRKRLELLYPGSYELDIKEDNDRYAVMLQLKMEKQK